METQKKLTGKRGPKPKELRADDFCRICKCNLKVRYGSAVSTENLFNSSKREGSCGIVLASLCQAVGISVEKSDRLSSRVCSACGRKIKNLCELFFFVNNSIGKSKNEIESCVKSLERTKRQFPTTVATPERSPCNRKQARKSSPSPRAKLLPLTEKSRKSLFSRENSPNSTTQAALLLAQHSNIEALLSGEKTMAKVIIVQPRGRVLEHSTGDPAAISVLRNLVSGNFEDAASAIFRHDELAKELPTALNKAIEQEFKEYCKSDSVLKGTSPDQLAGFSNKLVVAESRVYCPLWHSCVTGACGPSENATNSVALATAVVARARNPIMSALAFRISAVLAHGGVGYDDMKRLNRLGVCMSHDRIVELQKKMGSSSDAKVRVWKKGIEKNKRMIMFLEEVIDKQVPKVGVEDMNTPTRICLDEHAVCDYKAYSNDIHASVVQLLDRSGEEVDDDRVNEVLQQLRREPLPYYKIVGDNVDLEVHARIQTKEHRNQSLHWSHQFAERCRVIKPDAETKAQQKSCRELQLIELLPTNDVIQSLKKTWAILISRVVTKYLPPFHNFRNVVIHHIPHEYSKEMAERSSSCCLDLFFKNPNIAGEMAEILKTNQEKYVPSAVIDGETTVLSPVAQHGDQLYEERARNVQWAFGDGGTQHDRLQGIRPEFADWHAKVTLYKTEFATFVKGQSAGEVGTTRASINRTGKTNASKGVHSNYNEYKEFHEREIEAHICAAFMHLSSMKKLDDQPAYMMPEDNLPKGVKQKWLLELCEELVQRYVLKDSSVPGLVEQTQHLQEATKPPFSCRADGCHDKYIHHSTRVSHEIEKHGQNYNIEVDGERDEFGYLYCRNQCGKVFSTKATRNRHERTIHGNHHQEEEANPTQETSDGDPVYNYHTAKLTFGLLLFEFNDAIKEGDGERLFKVYKLALLLYKNFGHTKYAYVVLLYLVQITSILPEAQAIDMKWNRFHNQYGGEGKNIPLDLKKEQQNKVLKTMWKSLGSNLNESSATRMAQALDSLDGLMNAIDNECDLESRGTYRAAKDPEESVTQILGDLLSKDVFTCTVGRDGYPSFPNFKSNILHNLDYRQLHQWMRDHIKLWASIYEDRCP